MARLSSSVLLAILGLVAVLVGCATALSATGNPVPDWFQTLAVAGFGGVLGAYQPATSAAPVTAPPAAAARPTLGPPTGSAAPTP